MKRFYQGLIDTTKMFKIPTTNYEKGSSQCYNIIARISPAKIYAKMVH